ALATIAASYVSPRVRQHLRLGPLVMCYAMFAYFMYLGYRHDMALEDILGLLPVVAGIAVLARRASDVIVLLAYITALLLVVYSHLEAPRAHISEPFAIFVVFAGILGWMSMWRTRLEGALQVANATLEARVADRTASLEREVVERVAAERRANAASEAKSRFLANMSHELRTPLNAVIGYTELVEQELADSDQAHLCSDLDRVGRAARHLLTIIDDVLDLSRIEAGSRAFTSETVPVRGIIEDAVVLVQPAIDARRNRLTLTIAPDLLVLGDRAALVRVLVHLLDNAAKFTTAGEIDVVARGAGPEVAIEIHDTGIGIPSAAISQVFDRFTQADDSSTRLHGGAGLGLAICKEMVARMHGRITVTSEVGEGSVFTVHLPAL
ncbi:MAG TPA: ATP-binding protein, partial [Nannocystis sp.]